MRLAIRFPYRYWPCVALLLARTAPARAFDANEFWSEQAEVPLSVTVLEKHEGEGIAWQSMVYTSEFYRREPMRIFAYYAHPTAPGKYPAVVYIHGGGGGPDLVRAQAYAKAGYGCLAFDWNTYGDPVVHWQAGDPLPTQPYTVFGNLRYDEWKRTGKKWQQEDWGHQFFQPKPDWKGIVLYRGVMAARRALTWLGQQPEVDSSKLAVEGHSWGGFMAQLLAGIDPRIKAAVSAAAAGAWASRYHEGYAMNLQDLTPWDAFEWTRRYDPAAYADSIKAPILIRLESSDFFGSIDNLADYWPLIKAPKSLQLLAGNNHYFGTDTATAVAFFNHYLKTGPAFPAISGATLTPGPGNTWTLRVAAKGATPITKASFAWTTGTGTWDTRAWAQRPLKADADGWTATFSPVQAGGPLRVFASVRDGDGHVTSVLPVVTTLPAPATPPPATLLAATVPILRTAVSPLEHPEAWSKARVLGPLAGGPEVVGDESAQLATLWDDQFLYVKLDVDDRTPWLPAPAGWPLWVADSVQLRVNTNPPTPGVEPNDDKIVHLSWFPDPATGALRLDAQRRVDPLVPITDTGAITSHIAVRKDAGYTLTVRVPWHLIDATFRPAVNAPLHFAFQINYGDLLTNEWIGGINFNDGLEYNNPEGWGLATLLGEK